MSDSLSVRTSTGSIMVDSNQIVIEEGVRHHLKNLYLSFWKEGDSYHKVLLLNLVIALFTALTAIFTASAVNPLFFISMVAAIPIGFSSVVIFRELFTELTDENKINIDDVHYVSVREGQKILKQPKLKIYYTEGRHSKIRKVMLPPLIAPQSDRIVRDAVSLFKGSDITVK
jgi:hypothetical protein